MTTQTQIFAIECDPVAANEEFSDRRSAYQAGHAAAMKAIEQRLAGLDVLNLAQMLDFVQRARSESKLIETPQGPRIMVPYWFMRNPEGVLSEAPATGRASIPLGQWQDAFAAFAGAFDTPLARRRDDGEYARDARLRMREINEHIVGQTAAQQQSPAEWIDANVKGNPSLMEAMRLHALAADDS